MAGEEDPDLIEDGEQLVYYDSEEEDEDSEHENDDEEYQD